MFVVAFEHLLSFLDGPCGHCLDLAVILRLRIDGVHVGAGLRVVGELRSILEANENVELKEVDSSQKNSLDLFCHSLKLLPSKGSVGSSRISLDRNAIFALKFPIDCSLGYVLKGKHSLSFDFTISHLKLV